MTRRRTRLTLRLASCGVFGTLAVLPGCKQDQPEPAPADALQQAQQRAMEQNAEQDLLRAMTEGAPQMTEEELEEARQRMGLDEPAEPAEVVNVPTPEADAGLLSDETLAIGGVSFRLPSGWTATPITKPMRVAQYKVGESGEAVGFTIGGGVEANMDRWIRQMGETETPAERSSFDAGGVTVHTVELTGAYTGMTMTGSTPTQDGTTFFGAIIEGATTPIQIRLTISGDEADTAREQWNAFLASVAPAP